MMACTNMVLWVDARKKGSGEPLRKIKKNSWYSWWSDYLGVEQPEGLVPCEGRVKIEISISHGCECCTGPEVEVAYECDACGCTFYPELPRNTGDLEDLLNSEGVVTKAKNKKMQKAHVKAHEEAEEKRRVMLEERDAMIAKNQAKAAEKKKLIAEAKAARKKAAAKKKAKKA